MSRLQKKCLIGSAGFHLLLVVILFVGPAFLSSRRPPDDSQTITMIDLSKLTDGPTVTGGTPSQPAPIAPVALPQPVPSAPTPPPPQAAPPALPEKTLIEKIFAPEPPKEKVVEKVDKDAIDVSKEKVKVKVTTNDAEASTKPRIEVAKKLVKVSASASKTASTSEADSQVQQRAAARARAAAVSHILGNLENNLSTGTEVSVLPGQGAGAFVNYKEAVAAIYERAWQTPTDATDDKALATASVTIARDGTVISARIKNPSGDAATDRSVEQTLRRVKFIAPFPEGATDSERTFTIKFDLKKRLLG